MSTFLSLLRRPRRLRSSEAIRQLVQETAPVGINDLVAPVFVKESGAPEEVSSLAGQYRRSLEDTVKYCAELHDLGLRSVLLFPCLPASVKDAGGSGALDPEGLLLRTVREIKKARPGLLVMADVALDPYTSHGHDGVLNETGSDVLNDETVRILSAMAVLQAQAGVDVVAPSDMMDGRIGAIRAALDNAGYSQTLILSYASKFASALYGPFREAVGSKQAAGTASLDKRTYQLNPANPREALLEARLDEEQGADILMVKPAGFYLDILARLRMETALPLAAYQVSGEYAQMQAAAQRGWVDIKRVRDESLLAIKRAGADLIVTYFAEELAREFAAK